MKWTKEEINSLKEIYSARVYIDEIAKKYGRSRRAVQHKIKRLKLKRSPVRLKKAIKMSRKEIRDRCYNKNKKKIYERKRERIRRYKRQLIEYLGGKCMHCGYNKCMAALEFHHNKEGKESVIAIMIKDYSKQKALKEVNKCIILCANCHRELHHPGL
ncbi:hypothetical protein FJZ19_04810 [Candidatus Pacearchaeota archaeon]|nr:hypothetical protein [Candidatus Pacearchaeota archaeon]